MGAVSSAVEFVGDAVGGVVEGVGDVVGGAVEAVADAGRDIDDFVNDEIPGGWGTVATVAAPGIAAGMGASAGVVSAAAPVTAGAVTLDAGGDLEDALKAAALTYGAQELASSLSNSSQTSLVDDVADDFVPIADDVTPVFSEIMELPTDELLQAYDDAANAAVGAGVSSGIDIGDTIPATEEQLAGLYPENGTFLPEGIDVGDTIPTTPEQLEGLYPPDSAFLPEGIDVGDVIPYTDEQIAGLYPPGDTFNPPGYAGTVGIDTGDVIPTTPNQLEGLYPPNDTFLPEVPVVDMSTPATGTVTGGGLGDALTGAALGGAAGAVAGSVLENAIPQAPSAPTYTPPPRKDPDLSIKFSAPVKQLTAPESFNFAFSNQANPYLTQALTGNLNGSMLFDPSQAYASSLIQGLRAASNAPAFTNPGMTAFKATK